MEQWQVLIRDHLPAYITWDKYERNLERMKQNLCRAETKGTPRNGLALLGGLLVCGNCGWRMQVGYQAQDRMHYRCRHNIIVGSEECCGMTGSTLDELVAQQVLKALEPAALQLSLQAQADVRRERGRLDQQWRQRQKRARYETELAERRYREVDPENRLVAATLEQQWEKALRHERELQEQYDRDRQGSQPELSADELSKLEALSSDIPTLWHAPQTTNADRQAIVRCLVERVVVHVERNSEYVNAVIYWVGGYESRVEFRRRVQAYTQLRDYGHPTRRITELWKSGHNVAQTAEVLNAEGFGTINPDEGFNQRIVQELRNKLGLPSETSRSGNLTHGEWSLRDLAQHLKMSIGQLYGWAVRGWVHGRQIRLQKRWVIWADQDELSRLTKLLASKSQRPNGYSPELTTPKPRPM